MKKVRDWKLQTPKNTTFFPYIILQILLSGIKLEIINKIMRDFNQLTGTYHITFSINWLFFTELPSQLGIIGEQLINGENYEMVKVHA